MITLHFNSTTLNVQPNDSSYRYRSLMAKPQLILKFSLPRYIEIPVGAYCEYMGETYYLNSPQNIKKQGTRNIEYTLNMGTVQDNMALYKMRNSVDKRLKYSMNAKPHEFIEEIVANLNERDGAGVWSVGACIEGNEKTIEFNHTNIDDALSQVAETFETEWEIVGTTIHLHKVEYYKSDPLPLSYGKGNGFMPGVGRTTPSNELPIKRLYVQGGDKNIDRSKYGSPELLLPKSQSLGYDGTYFDDEEGYDATKAHIYTSDANGYYIERSDVVSDAVKEDSLDCSSHYPSRIGHVTSVIAVKPEKNFYDIIDNTIPAALNINDYIIEGETPTIIFQSGMLSGEKEFEFKYKHSERRFEIVPQEIDGQTMPNATFIPAITDTYAIFGIMLPDSYICDNTTKQGASWDMMREAVKHLWENEGQKFTFTGTLQSLYAKRNWVNIGGKLIIGGYVHFSDTQFAQDGVDIRIIGIKDFLTTPYAPTVEISNNVVGQSLTSKLREIDAQEVIIEENHKTAIQYTKRRFRDAQETLSMLEDAFDNFSGGINPVTVQTMAMLVGDESLQFQFVTGLTSTTIDTSFQVTYDAANKQLNVPHSFLRHMTLGIDTIKPSHAVSEYKTWEMTAFISARLDDASKKYYLYAQVDTAAAQNGVFLLSETPIDMNRDSGYYYLLLGVLNTEYEGLRSYVSLYGFTEILPARITTDKIVSGDGNSYFDMLHNAMKLGSALDFNSHGDGKLRIRGTIVQSQGGDAENVIGCYRGVYSSSTTYYNGDEVTYTTADGNTSTYRYIYSTPSSGNLPTNTLYWQVIAQGVQGIQGVSGISPNTAFKSTVFKRSNASVATPTGGTYANPVPQGWSDGVPTGEEQLWASTRIFSSDGLAPQQSEWTTPQKLTDTASFDVEFSSVENPNPPSGHPNTNSQWSNTADETTIWMATAKKSNGVWDAWQVSRIKGENGTDGTSLSVKGACYNHFENYEEWQLEVTTDEPLVLVDSEIDSQTNETEYNVYYKYGRPRPGWAPGWRRYVADVGDAFVMESDGHLWMADSDGWKDIGQFRGQTGATGADGQNAYVHIKYARSMTVNDWSANNGETPDAYIGIYTDHNPADQLVWSLYTWKKWQGEDGFGYEYIYKRTNTATPPNTPTATSQTDDFVPSGWTDDPTGVDENNMYEWMCYRKKTYGVWGSFIGSSADNTKAALFLKYGKDGTSTRILGTALGHYADMTAFNAAKDGLDEGLYLIDVVNGVYSQVAALSSGGTVTLSVADEGDGYILQSTGHLFCATSSGWNDVGQIRGDDGQDGQDGVNGNYTEFRYAVNGSTTQPPSLTNTALNPSGWSTSMPSVGNLQYLWMTSATKSGDGTTLITLWTAPVRVTPYNGQDGRDGQDGADGQDGQDGRDGRDGQDGQDGRGITGVTEYYAVSDNRYIAPQSWSESIPTLTPTLKYLWNKERVYYSKGTAYEETPPVVIGVYGDDGRGITSVTEMYLATSLSSGVTKNTVGWSSSVQNVSQENPYLYNYEIIRYTDGSSAETDISLIGHWGADGQDGQDGRDGEDGSPIASIYRGNYSSSKIYYGNSSRVDIVKFGAEYYVTRIDAPNGDIGFSDVSPTNTDYWNSFGASFESVATDLLLAELANIAGFIFRNGRLESQKLANGQTTSGETSETPMALLDGNNGRAAFAGGKVVFNADGTVNIGNGKFTIDAQGNVSMNNVAMSNILANSGTFKGTLNATGGLQLPCTTSSNQYDYTPSSNTAVHINYYNGDASVYVFLPSNPVIGQTLFIRFAGGKGKWQASNGYIIHGNGHYIYAKEGTVCSSFYFITPYGQAYLSNYDIYVLTPYGGHAYNPCAQFVFDGYNWHVVSSSHATIKID